MGYITSSYIELDSVRLGNKLWIIASMIGVALENGLEFRIPRKWGYSEYFDIPESMYIDEVPQGITPIKDTFKYEEIKLDKNTNYDLQGFFQQYKYFEKYKDVVYLTLSPKVELQQTNGVIVAHVRRGDYALYPDKHPILPISYYEKALSDKNDCQINIVTDEYEWCKNNLFLDKHECHFVSGCSNIEDLFTMANANFVIMANSSFSWWGAFFAWMRNKATIICPSKEQYYGSGNSHISTEYIYPSEWKQISY